MRYKERADRQIRELRKKENVRILAIETSCDETAAAVVENGRRVLSNTLFTQIAIHAEYGGVVPEIASRNHLEKLPYIVDQALRARRAAPLKKSTRWPSPRDRGWWGRS